jgi:bifunctional non-homologous end joining protein LigD
LWVGGGLRWIGAVGTGFDDNALRLIREALNEMTTAQSPFLSDSEIPRKATWVTPQLVAIVEFKEWTNHGRLRAPSFKGFTDDPVESVTWESEGPQ